MENSRILKDDLTSRIRDFSTSPREIKHSHKGFIKFLKKFDHHDEFYLKANLNSNSVDWSWGLNKWLGINDVDKDHFPVDFLAQLVHPFVRDWYLLYTNAAMLVLADIPTEPLLNRFVINIPVKKDGRYFLVKQMTMPFQHDGANKAISFIHSYTLIGEYRHEPMKIEFFQGHIKMGRECPDTFKDKVAACVKIDDNDVLTEPNYNTIKAIRSLRQRGREVTDRTLAEEIQPTKKGKDKLKPNTTRKYLSALRDKLIKIMQHDREKTREPFFPPKIKALTVFDFFEQSGFIDFLDIL